MLISYLEKKSAPSAEYVHHHVDIHVDLMKEYFFSGGKGKLKEHEASTQKTSPCCMEVMANRNRLICVYEYTCEGT